VVTRVEIKENALYGDHDGWQLLLHLCGEQCRVCKAIKDIEHANIVLLNASLLGVQELQPDLPPELSDIVNSYASDLVFEHNSVVLVLPDFEFIAGMRHGCVKFVDRYGHTWHWILSPWPFDWLWARNTHVTWATAAEIDNYEVGDSITVERNFVIHSGECEPSALKNLRPITTSTSICVTPSYTITPYTCPYGYGHGNIEHII